MQTDPLDSLDEHLHDLADLVDSLRVRPDLPTWLWRDVDETAAAVAEAIDRAGRLSSG